jgi:hypothetical protein
MSAFSLSTLASTLEPAFLMAAFVLAVSAAARSLTFLPASSTLSSARLKKEVVDALASRTFWRAASLSASEVF